MLNPTATLPRLSDAGVKPSASVSPVPVSAMVCLGLPGQLSFSVTALFWVPATVGVKVTVIVQFWPEASVVRQVWLWENSPLAAMLLNCTEGLLTLVTVTVWGGLVCPICRRPTFRVEAENVRVSGG